MPVHDADHTRPATTVLAVVCALVTLLGFAACDRASTSTPAPDAGLTAQENTIRDAVAAMQQRGDGATLMVLDADENPILKLAHQPDGITAELPLDWLDDNQLAAARTLFADAGAAGSGLPDRNTTDLFPSLTVTLGGDPEQAARFTADLMEQAYALAPQDELLFETEND